MQRQEMEKTALEFGIPIGLIFLIYGLPENFTLEDCKLAYEQASPDGEEIKPIIAAWRQLAVVEIKKSKTLSEIYRLYKNSPPGSPEEKQAEFKLNGLSFKKAEENKTIISLALLYEMAPSNGLAKDTILKKMISKAKTEFDWRKLSQLAPKDSPEQLTILKKWKKLIKQRVAKFDSVEKCHQALFSAPLRCPERILIAKKILTLNNVRV